MAEGLGSSGEPENSWVSTKEYTQPKTSTKLTFDAWFSKTLIWKVKRIEI